MNEIKWSLKISQINWKWVGIGYCFFVVFHLLPSYIINGFYFNMEDLAGRGIWLFFGLAIIAFYIGYRSRGVTILEPAISALFYDITLLLEFRSFWGRTVSHSWGIIYVWGILTLVLAICSAWLGELFQASKKAKAEKPPQLQN
jgi:hypothetical protein